MLQASLLVGVVWLAWHLPLLLARPGELLPGLVGIVSASVVFGWLYQASGGAVLLPLLMHTAQNTFGGEFAGPMFSGADVTRLSWLRGGLLPGDGAWCWSSGTRGSAPVPPPTRPARRRPDLGASPSPPRGDGGASTPRRGKSLGAGVARVNAGCRRTGQREESPSSTGQGAG